jgi:hypothetical protein
MRVKCRPPTRPPRGLVQIDSKAVDAPQQLGCSGVQGVQQSMQQKPTVPGRRKHPSSSGTPPTPWRPWRPQLCSRVRARAVETAQPAVGMVAVGGTARLAVAVVLRAPLLGEQPRLAVGMVARATPQPGEVAASRSVCVLASCLPTEGRERARTGSSKRSVLWTKMLPSLLHAPAAFATAPRRREDEPQPLVCGGGSGGQVTLGECRPPSISRLREPLLAVAARPLWEKPRCGPRTWAKAPSLR